jgi:hypothetical protein
MGRNGTTCPVCDEAYRSAEESVTAYGDTIIYWHETGAREIFCLELSDGTQASVVDENPDNNSKIDPARQ